MKNIKVIFSLMLALALGVLTSCSDDFTQPPVPTPDGGAVGDGSWQHPMTAWQVNKNTKNPQYPTDAWSYGYIVGCIDTSIGVYKLNEKTGVFEAPFTVQSNLCITWLTPEEFKAIPDDQKYEYCAAVQLSSGTPTRSALNLSDNPDNQYKPVCIQGSTGTNYLGVGAIRLALDYKWLETDENGVITGEIVGNPPVDRTLPAPVGPFYQNFQKYSAFSDYELLGWENAILKGSFVGWTTATYGSEQYMACDASLAAVAGGPYTADLYSPAIDMAKVETKTLQFSYRTINDNRDSSLEVYYVTRTADSDETNPAGVWSEPVRLNLAPLAKGPKTGFGEWKDSNAIDISACQGIVRFIWRYNATKGGMNNNTTYCVDNVNVGGQPAPVIVDFGKDLIASLLNSTDTDTGWTYDNIKLGAGMNWIWQWASDGYLKASGFVGGSARDSEGIAISPVISLKGYTGCNVVFDHAARFQTTLKELCHLVVREAGTTEWTEVEIPYWPEPGGWNFKSSGQCDLSPFDGKDIEIGFRYGSDSRGADTWEIKNVQVMGKK